MSELPTPEQQQAQLQMMKEDVRQRGWSYEIVCSEGGCYVTIRDLSGNPWRAGSPVRKKGTDMEYRAFKKAYLEVCRSHEVAERRRRGSQESGDASSSVTTGSDRSQ